MKLKKFIVTQLCEVKAPLGASSLREGVKDWLDEDRTIDSLARTEAAKYPGGELTVHHIFARKVLSDAGLPVEVANRPATFALLSRSTNAEFGAMTTEEVLRSLTPEQRKRAGIQFFGEAAGDRLRHEHMTSSASGVRCVWRRH